MPPVFGHRPRLINNPIPSGQPVCVAVTFNVNGEMRIDSFGAEVNGMRFRYNIISCRLLNEHNGMCTFECIYVEFGLTKTIRFKYFVTACQWTVA